MCWNNLLLLVFQGANASALEKEIGSEQFPVNEHYFGLVNVSKHGIKIVKCMIIVHTTKKKSLVNNIHSNNPPHSDSCSIPCLHACVLPPSSLETPVTVTQCSKPSTSAVRSGRRSWLTAANRGVRKNCSPAWLTWFTALQTRRGRWELSLQRSSLHDYAKRTVRGGEKGGWFMLWVKGQEWMRGISEVSDAQVSERRKQDYQVRGCERLK